MFVLKTVVMIMFFNSTAPVLYADAITISFDSRRECEAQSARYGERVAKLVADELKRAEMAATIYSVANKCLPIGVPA